MANYQKKTVTHEVEAYQLNWANLDTIHEVMGPALAAHNRGGPTHITKGEAHDTCGEAGPEYIKLMMPGAVPAGRPHEAVHGDWIVSGGPGWWMVYTPAEFAAEYTAVTDA